MSLQYLPYSCMKRIILWLSAALIISLAGCFIGIPLDLSNVAGMVINSDQPTEVVVVLHNSTKDSASWTVVWETEASPVPYSRQVKTDAGQITSIVLSDNVQRVSLGSLGNPLTAVTIQNSKTVEVSYSGPIFAVGEQLFQGDVLRFTLEQTESGPIITADVIPAG